MEDSKDKTKFYLHAKGMKTKF